MNLPIEKHVFHLLKHYDCVIITGLGGFILNHRDAYLNQITNTIHPPSKIISFNQNLIQNDGLLANYLANVENISYDEACLEIMKFSRKAKLKLQKKKSIFFQNIGTIQLNENNKLEFISDSIFNFNQHAYGLKSFQLAKLKNKTKYNFSTSAAAAIILLICISIFSLNTNLTNTLLFNLNPLNTNNYTPRTTLSDIDSLGREKPGIYTVQASKVDPDLYKINGTNYHVTTKRCLKEGFGIDVQIKIWKDEKDRTQRNLCFLNWDETEYSDCYKITNVYNEITSESPKVMVMLKNGRMKEALFVFEETYIDPYVILNNDLEQNKEDTQDTLLFVDIPNRFKNAIESITKPDNSNKKKPEIKIEFSEEETLRTKKNVSQKTKKIHIIVGSFSEEKNANAYIKQLKNRGFKSASVIGTNKYGLIRVGVASFFTEKEADEELINIKSKLSSAWILNTNE